MARAGTERILVLMFTDIVDSVNMKQELGGQVYATLSSRHDALFGEIVASMPDAQIIKDTGDGFMARFATTSDAVLAALRFQRGLAREPWGDRPIQVRIGIHIGQVSEMGVDALGAPKIVGLAADMAARVMGLALPGQILMTRTPFDDARQYLREKTAGEGKGDAPVRWMAHGPYVFKGNDEPVDVFEAGYDGIAPLRPPPNSEKANRAVSETEEALFGWRPASGLEVPGREGWELERKVGEGGFGEVWLATHRMTRDQRVFKFCFDADRLQSFVRELTLFRLIRESLGERNDIARLFEIQLGHPPYFLESEYTEHGDLVQWTEREGSLASVPLETRLDLVARTADAVAAAHSIGILHKDIKPSNILMYVADDGSPRPRLADFGIGMITDRSRFEGRDITIAGFTNPGLADEDAKMSGTAMYSPPESLVGKPFTIQGDIYALGVLLYQMAVGRLDEPLGAGWEREIDNAELREDIARCVDHDPERRLANATELAQRLRDLEARGAQRRTATRRIRIRRVAVGLSAALSILALALTLHIGQISRERDRANQEAETAKQVSEFLVGLFEVSDPGEARGNTITAREILDTGARRIAEEMKDQPQIQGRLMTTMGRVYRELGLYDDARPLLSEAPRILEESVGSDHPDLASSLVHLAILESQTGEYARAGELFERALEIRREALGPESPEVAAAQNTYALLLARTGDHERARELYESSLAILERVRGRDHTDVAPTLNNLGLLLAQRGEFAAARPLYERALAIKEASLGADHPSIAGALNNLAILLKNTGELEAARPLYERSLAIQEKVYGADHPRVAVCLNNLAILHKENGDLDRARRLLERALRIDEEALGPDHPEVAGDLNNLADVLAEAGDYDRARTMLERALRIDEATLGPDHVYVASDLDSLAGVLAETGEPTRALELFDRALGILEKAYGSEHPDVATTLGHLGNVLHSLGRNEEALTALERALAVREKTLGDAHPKVAETLTDLAGPLRDAGRDADARSSETRAAAILRNAATGA